MNNNPFLSKTFISIWLKYFYSRLTIFGFDFIDIKFLKTKFIPLYTNVGRNITNGMSYKLFEESQSSDFKNKVFLIYDVPTYFNIAFPNNSKLKTKRIDQYSGVLTNISNYQTFDEYMQHAFRAKRRSYLKKRRYLLESNYNISYSAYFGEMSDDVYKDLANNLKELVYKRFSSLKKSNSIIDSWDYYYDLMKCMIEQKKAVMICVNKDGKPIGMTFNFLSDSTLFYAITTSDTDYYKYSLGHVNIMSTFEWCFENNIKIFDFSKGVSEYKSKWKNEEYQFQYHVLYDSNSFYAIIIANIILNYFKFKQYLRQVGINSLYSKFTFRLKGLFR
jgi:hypothetical protein